MTFQPVYNGFLVVLCVSLPIVVPAQVGNDICVIAAKVLPPLLKLLLVVLADEFGDAGIIDCRT